MPLCADSASWGRLRRGDPGGGGPGVSFVACRSVALETPATTYLRHDRAARPLACGDAERPPSAAGSGDPSAAEVARAGRRAHRACPGRAVARGAGPEAPDPVDASVRAALLGGHRAAARRVPVVLDRAPRHPAEQDRPLSPRRRLHGTDQRLAGPVRRSARHEGGRPGGDARLPARARALLARLPRRPGRARGAARRRRRPRDRRRLVGRRAGAGDRGVGARPRRPAAAAAPADVPMGRPDHLHSRDGGARPDRPVAVHRQAACVRRLVGRNPRRPRPARGEPRPR